MKPKIDEKLAAILKLYNPGLWTKEYRLDVANWLIHHADALLIEGTQYTTHTFTGRKYKTYCWRKKEDVKRKSDKLKTNRGRRS